jgi:hypothetical protein
MMTATCAPTTIGTVLRSGGRSAEPLVLFGTEVTGPFIRPRSRLGPKVQRRRWSP